MKQFILLIILCFASLPNPITAQTWLANDHVWTYKIMGGFAGVDDLFTMNVGIDTTINGQACKKMAISGSVINYPMDRFAYAEGDRVYAYHPQSNAFVKLYDFTLNVGETLVVPGQSGTFQYRVDLIDTVQAGPLSLRRQRVTYLDPNGTPTNWNFDILEGIGMVGNPFTDTLPSCSYFFLDEAPLCNSAIDGFDLKFVCFQSNAGNFTPYNIDCLVLDTETPEDLPLLSLWPNPVGDWLQLEVGNLEVRRTRVLSVQGQILQTMNGLPEQVSVTGLPTGMYFISIELETGQQLTQRFVKL